MTTQQSNTKLTMPIEDTIILDSKKCNAALLTIHADGRITVAEHLKPTETAAKVLQIIRETWMADAQSIKIRDQQERIKRLEEYIDNLQKLGDSMALGRNLFIQNAWTAAKEAKP
jgi:uncharacterized protein HemY